MLSNNNNLFSDQVEWVLIFICKNHCWWTGIVGQVKWHQLKLGDAVFNFWIQFFAAFKRLLYFVDLEFPWFFHNLVCACCVSLYGPYSMVNISSLKVIFSQYKTRRRKSNACQKFKPQPGIEFFIYKLRFLLSDAVIARSDLLFFPDSSTIF